VNDTVIVGAGPAGLAVAACLRRSGAPFTVIEQATSGVGPRWRTRYRRLHLHTAKQYSGLPYLPFPASHPRYPSREQVVEYLELYRRHFGIEPRLGERVTALASSDGGWSVATDGGAYRARQVVLCTGRSDVPHRPRWPGDDTFPGEVLHSAEYESGERFAGKRVLVVGLGNSGAEIAIDLVEWGARPDIAVRSPVNVVPRDVLGRPIQRTAILLSFLPLRVRDAIGRLTSRAAFGDLTAIGMPRPSEGPVSQIAHRGRIPVIDVGTVALVRAGKIALRPDVARFDGDRVQFVDGQMDHFDAVILATGYRTAVASLSPDLATVLGGSGLPRALAEPAFPGLYFLGFKTPPTGHLRQIAIDAVRVASSIARRGARPTPTDFAP
jgi:indole-3-pyruvate monooxygenase